MSLSFSSFGQDSSEVMLERSLEPILIRAEYLRKREGSRLKENPFVCLWPPEGDNRPHGVKLDEVLFRNSSFNEIVITRDDIERF